MDEKNKNDQKGSKISTEASCEQSETKACSISSPKNNNNNNSELSNSGSSADANVSCNEKSHKRKSSCGNANNAKDGGGNTDKTSSNASIASKEDNPQLINVKKEENSLSPMSPVRFDSMPNPDLSTGCNTVKVSEKTGLSAVKSNGGNEKISSPCSNVGCKEEINANINSNPGNALNTLNSGGQHQQSSVGGSNNAGSLMGCLEFMQQQNHIFVFSTQLANKGAESVMSGQFQTIIAYHCSQPSTKTFLEEFFMKNPLKMSKLPRNMALSVAHGGNGNQWAGSNANVSNSVGSCGGISKLGIKTTTNKSLVDIGRTVAGSNNTSVTGLIESNNDNENDLIQCWENNRNLVPSDIKVEDNHEHSQLSNKNNPLETKLGSIGNEQIPSLQGVKVPDENLTPQQRQHREEQLAKLKKMNQFLFPEHDTIQTSQQLNKIPNEGGTSSISSLMLNLAGGTSTNIAGLSQLNSTLRHNMLPNQQQTAATMCDSENMSVLGGSGDQLNTDNISALQSKSANPNLMTLNMHCGSQTSNLLSGSINETNLPNNSAFNQDEKLLTNSAVVSVAQEAATVDWPKLQQPLYVDERLKGSKPLNTSNMRANLTSTTGSNNTQRPPPPYHSTRSASVPIATQSPNPASPNNPTSNLSLPSPVSGSIVPRGVTNSPNMEFSNGVPTPHNNSGVQINKCTLPPDGASPLNNNNNSRNRNNQSQLNSNPSTPLSNMSPKELEALNASNPADTHPQQSNVDSRFPTTSSSFSFPSHMQNVVGNGSFKAQLERQHSAPAANAVFGRRAENMPLNPNTNRAVPHKLGTATFDPISSLAQMSQQLTSCVSSNVGNSPSNVGCNELNMPASIALNHQSIEGMLQNMESNMVDGSNMPNIPSQITGTGNGMFGPHNCNMNALMVGNISPQQRLLNPKMCAVSATGLPAGFNNPGNSSNQTSFHGVLPPNHRLRMPSGMNFNNFNVSPNIQVKASTPNTIQYMPVRPQNNNNVRAAPSLDFLQRYANPSQTGGNVGPNLDSHSNCQLAQMNAAGVLLPDGNKMVNALSSSSGMGAPGINFFQHCNQVEQDDMNSGNQLAHELNVGMIRGVRPMIRQHNIGPGGGNVQQRMLTPNNGGTMQYPGAHAPNQDSLDCGDVTNLFSSGNQSALVNSSSNGPQLPIVNSVPNTNSINYKPFVGPASNDVKYAQQYHSFQQQLYATSTRSQQQNLSSVAANVQNSNTPFFVNK